MAEHTPTPQEGIMKERFEAEYAKYVPARDDNPENMPFYAAYAALRSLWPDLGEHVWHQCACAAGWAQSGSRYDAALATARDMAARAEMPREPYVRISYSSPPASVSDDDVVEMVRDEYKRAFPGRRWGTAHAKEQFEKVKAKARNILEQRQDAALRRHETEEAKIREENAARRAEYDAEVARVQKLRAAVAQLGV